MHVLFRTVKVCIVIGKPLSVANSISPFFYIVSNKVTIYPSVVHILLEVIENAFQFKNSTLYSLEFFEYINCVFNFTLLMPVSKSSSKPCVCKKWKTMAIHMTNFSNILWSKIALNNLFVYWLYKIYYKIEIIALIL